MVAAKTEVDPGACRLKVAANHEQPATGWYFCRQKCRQIYADTRCNDFKAMKMQTYIAIGKPQDPYPSLRLKKPAGQIPEGRRRTLLVTGNCQSSGLP